MGIGGVRLLRALDIRPAVFHMNEGHSAFLTLELLREQLAKGKNLKEAMNWVKERCVFTTHTPVTAGHDPLLCPAIRHLQSGSLNFPGFETGRRPLQQSGTPHADDFFRESPSPR